jgi:hypothetical protein
VVAGVKRSGLEVVVQQILQTTTSNDLPRIEVEETLEKLKLHMNLRKVRVLCEKSLTG